MKHSKPAITFIFVTLLLDVLGFGLLIPVGPRLVQHLLHGGEGGTEGEAVGYVGLLAATYSAMQFVFAPVLGAISDRVGRRPVLLVSIFGSGLDYFAMALSPNLGFLFLTRALNGMSGASMTVASAYVADVTPPEKRAAGFGMVGAAFGLGFILGPVIGGVIGDPKIEIPLIGHGNIHYPFFVAGGLSLLNWLYGLFVLPESLPPERRAKELTLAKMNPVAVFAGLGKYPFIVALAGSFFFMHLAMFGLHTTWVLYTKHRFDWSPAQVGVSLMLVGIGAAIVQGGLARKIIPALGERHSLLYGVIIGVAAYIAYGAATQGWMIYVAVVIASLGGISQPAAQALITKGVQPDEQGAVQGALTGIQSVASIVGPLLASSIFAYSISERAKAPLNTSGLTFFVGAALCFVGLLLAVWATRHMPAHRGASANSA